MNGTDSIVTTYEVFSNGSDALAFFMPRHPPFDGMAEEGPFWFSIQNNLIIAGDDHSRFAAFPDLAPELLDIARQRGVIMLVEFENSQPLRCTPCYLAG